MSRRTCFVCDRCGAKFDIPMFTRLRLFVRPTVEETKNGVPITRETHIDLCDECMETLINWLDLGYDVKLS